MSVKPKVLLLGDITHATEAWSSLSEITEIITPKASNRTAFIAECHSGALDGIQAMYRTAESSPITGRFDRELINALPTSLRFISHNAAGYDQIDIADCMTRNIRVSNCPTAVDDATADMTLFLILGAMRNLAAGMATLRSGTWRGTGGIPLGHDPQGKVLGILGMGGIGRNVARKARAFGMEIRYFNRTRLGPELEEGAEYVSFEELLRESDVLSLNLPLNAATRHTISTAQFEMMKPGVFIVNTARGAVMDEAALVAALASGRVAGAGLDVFEKEPEIHPGLMANDKVLLVPHMGTFTEETHKKMEEWTISNVRMAIEQGKLRSIVAEQKSLS